MSETGGIFNLKKPPSHCELCFQPLGDGRTSLVGGLLLCTPCDSGAMKGRLDFRGFQFLEKIEHGTATKPGTGLPNGLLGERIDTYSIVASQVLMQRELPLEARFYPERDGGSLLSLFRRELQVGDELFDKSIYIESKRDETTKELLSSSGLQSAIMEVVFDTGRLSFAGHGIWTQSLLGIDMTANTAAVRRSLAVVTHYLDLFCQHLERPDEVAWP